MAVSSLHLNPTLYEAYGACVISVLDDDSVILGGDSRGCTGLKSLRLTQQPCGVLVLTVSSDETLPPILTTCGLSIRKSKIHLQVRVGNTRAVSFTDSFPGLIVLKAEL